jgi:large subunit ribosomal protein L17
MAYRKLGVTTKHRKSMLANLTKDLIMNERIETTETRAKEVRRAFDKMVTHAKKGTLLSRRLALASLQNDNEVVKKLFEDLAKRFANRNGGYTRILKLTERRGDDALIVVLELVEGE